MPRNGSGSYSLPALNPVVTNTTIQTAWGNNTMNDVASALTASIANDGQTTITANLPMSGKRHTGVGNSSVRSDYASAADVQDGTLIYLTGVAGTNTITATAPNSMLAYATGQMFHFLPANSSTGAVTININLIGAKTIAGTGLVANVPVTIIYDGSQFQPIPYYKEGTWTPSVGGTATYTYQFGRYTKIGRQVFIEGRIKINARGTGSQTSILGLPFSSSSTAALPAFSLSYFSALAITVVYIVGQMTSSSTTLGLYSSTAAASGIALNNVIGDNTELCFSGSYTVD